MIIRKAFYFSLLMAGCAAASYAVRGYSRHQEKRASKQEIQNWEHEGGNLAPYAPGSTEPSKAVR